MANPITQIATFVRESRDELKKVTWPERDEVTSFTIVVVVAVLIIAIFLGLIDTLFTTILNIAMFKNG
jgi:preprotein translocase subunit SecE